MARDLTLSDYSHSPDLSTVPTLPTYLYNQLIGFCTVLPLLSFRFYLEFFYLIEPSPSPTKKNSHVYSFLCLYLRLSLKF